MTIFRGIAVKAHFIVHSNFIGQSGAFLRHPFSHFSGFLLRLSSPQKFFSQDFFPLPLQPLMMNQSLFESLRILGNSRYRFRKRPVLTAMLDRANYWSQLDQISKCAVLKIASTFPLTAQTPRSNWLIFLAGNHSWEYSPVPRKYSDYGPRPQPRAKPVQV